MAKKGSIAEMIIGLGPKKSEGKEDVEASDESDHDSGLMSASEEIISAIESKDPSALVDALKSFIDMCDSGSYGEEK